MNLNENRNIDSKIFLQTVSGRIKIIEKKELVHSRKKLQIQIKSKTLRYLNFTLINTLYQKLKNNPTLKAILGITLVLLLSNIIYPIGCQFSVFRKLNIDKTTQDTDIPTTFLKGNALLFDNYICICFNDTISSQDLSNYQINIF